MLVIRLIGQPCLERDGVPVDGPRGHKSWALLGMLVRSTDPVSRKRLVDDLFSEADDPMGALRWSLAELRRRTGLHDAFMGNPVSTALGEATVVDVTQTASGILPDKIPEGDFLEGIEIRGSASFQTWLLIERQRVDSELASALRQATLRALSGRHFERATELAGALVRRSPLEEGPHVLLVKALAASGDADAALHQVEESEAMFLRELGVPPTGAIRAAARRGVSTPVPGVSSRATSDSLRVAGLAAVSAGAADAGIECLRAASAAAESSGDPSLLGECLLELGTALVHSIRGYDDEGSVILQLALEAATEAGAELTAARALSELAYVDLLAGRRHSATRYLAAAAELATDAPALVAALAGFEAMNLSDWGKIDQAADRFTEAIELSKRAGAVRREGWSLGLGARTLFIQGRLSEAADWARRSRDLAHQERWIAFRPWPEVWISHVRLANGDDPHLVRRDTEGTFALSRQLQDPCWEGAAAKVIGLTYMAEGDHEMALQWMADASMFCRRATDSYRWLDVEILLTEAGAALASGDHDRAKAVAHEAMTEAAKGSMEDLLAHAQHVLAVA